MIIEHAEELKRPPWRPLHTALIAALVLAVAAYAILAARRTTESEKLAAALEFSSLAREAVASYYTDHGRFASPEQGRLPDSLLTPRNYVGFYAGRTRVQLPIDPFDLSSRGQVLTYRVPRPYRSGNMTVDGLPMRYTIQHGQAFVISNGPDADSDFNMEHNAPQDHELLEFVYLSVYDPTNGALSSGDIIRHVNPGDITEN